MDPTTANALLRRLDDLELRVGASSDDEDGADLKNQVKYLQRDLHKLYETRPEIKIDNFDRTIEPSERTQGTCRHPKLPIDCWREEKGSSTKISPNKNRL